MNIDDYFKTYTGGNSNVATWTPKAIKEFAKDYHTEQLNILGVSNRFLPIELQNILSKVKRVKIVNNFKEILVDKFGIENYDDEAGDCFFEQYTGKEVNVFQWYGDWWITEDDNYPITKKCFVSDL